MNINNKNKTKKINKKMGGNVETSGGFGCLFIPVLKCKNKTIKHGNTKMVSKLMTQKNANREYRIITSVKMILKKIPDYNKYFLLDNISLCSDIDKIPDKELTNFDEKCNALTKKGYSSKNINKNLTNIASLNIPYGGIDVSDYLIKYKDSQKYINFNDGMIKLLLNGIIKMNDLGIYHCDIKDTNILININKNKIEPKLIDWGLAFYFENNSKTPKINLKKTSNNDKYNNNSKQKTSDFLNIYNKSIIPEEVRNRSLHYNLPVSLILFNSFFRDEYEKFLIHRSKTEQNEAQLNDFIIDTTKIFFKDYSKGHVKSIEILFTFLFKYDIQSNNSSKKENTKKSIKKIMTFYYVNYIRNILIKYTKNNSLDIELYFCEIFRHIIDIYGFIISYVAILELLYMNYNKLSVHGIRLYTKLRTIFIFYLFSNSTEVINVNDLTHELKELNDYFDIFDNNNIKSSRTILSGIKNEEEDKIYIIHDTN